MAHELLEGLQSTTHSESFFITAELLLTEALPWRSWVASCRKARWPESFRGGFHVEGNVWVTEHRMRGCGCFGFRVSDDFARNEMDAVRDHPIAKRCLFLLGIACHSL
jgi:hypothetical protein